MRVIGYGRVSTTEQAQSGLGLKAQLASIRQEAERRGWKLLRVYEDRGASGKCLTGRPELAEAIRVVEAGEAEALVVAKLDRLSRSLLDFASLMDRSRRKGWSLVALDLNIDTTTPNGELLANVMSSFAQFERRLIGQRTREALAQKRAEGVRLGRPRMMSDEVVGRVKELRAEGLSLRSVAEWLNAEGVPTAHGGAAWHASTVRNVLHATD